MRRFALFGLIAVVVWSAEQFWLAGFQPETSTHLSLAQVNGGDLAAARLRQFEALKDLANQFTAALVVITAWFLFRGWLRQLVGLGAKYLASLRLRKLLRLLAALLLVTPLLSGCIKPYDTPEYREIDTSETGFLIPLEGEGSSQAKFQSEDYLKQRKVAAKRVQITHRWSQEGRWHGDGRWLPTVRLIKVNRSPVTREWVTTQTSTAAGAMQRLDQAIWVESGDSVGFSMGFTCTAYIPEEEAARFLYWYPSGSLADVMDKEVRGRVQQAAAEVATKYPLDILRSHKQEIADAVKKDVTNFFATRGVMITTVGMFGGMTYENPQIQKSIDETFVAQQLKVVAEAKYQAQQKENDRLVLEANGIAEKARREAQGLADARKLAAAAEAEAIRVVNLAAEAAQQNPLLYQLKTLEVERARIEKWDGRYPQFWLSPAAANAANSAPGLLLQIPGPGAAPMLGQTSP